jgi:DNA-binding MarR family transcriptional regulator
MNTANVIAIGSGEKQRSATGHPPFRSRGHTQIDREWYHRIEPLLSARERRVYGHVVLECDGWDRAITATTIARKTLINPANVRRDIKALEEMSLIRREFVNAPQAREGWRCRILRAYDEAERRLRARHAAKRCRGEHTGIASDSIASIAADTCVDRTPVHVPPQHMPSFSQIETKSIPPSPSLPNAPTRVARDGGGGTEVLVSDELVMQVQRRWPNEHPKIVRPRLERVARMVEPPATQEELKLYVKAAGKDLTLDTPGTRRPFLAACTEERFRPWMEKWRRRVGPHLVRADEVRNSDRDQAIGRPRQLPRRVAQVLPLPGFMARPSADGAATAGTPALDAHEVEAPT